MAGYIFTCFPMWWSLYLLYLGTVYVVAVQKTCTDLGNLPLSPLHSRLDGAVVVTMVTGGVVTCARECLSRSICLSFNFHLDNGSCEINMAAGPNISSGILMTTDNSYVFSQVNSWQQHLVGACKGHSCPGNTKCAETENGDHECVITHCENPRSPNSNETTSELTPVNQSLPLTCHVGSAPCGQITCNPDGYWSNMTCMTVSSCEEVQRLSENYTDGEYWLYPNIFTGVRVKVYCHGMNSTPGEFLSLNTPYFMDAPRLKNRNCDGEEEHSNVILGLDIYSKFGLDIQAMTINREDRTFHNKTSEHRADVGVVRDCYSAANSSCGPRGHAVLDLRGTGLALHESVEWQISWGGGGAWDPQVVRSSSDQLIDIRCGGVCGACIPSGPMFLVSAENDIVPEDSAISPRCQLSGKWDP